MRIDKNSETKPFIRTIFLDLNGTLTIRGKLPRGVRSKIRKLKQQGIKCILISGDQRGTASQFAESLGIELIIAKNSLEKAKIISSHGPHTSAAVGNARIDSGLFRKAALAIATLQGEGIHAAIIKDVDIIVPSILDALDLLLDKDSLEATLKK